MSYEARVLADSISPDEKRLTTLEVTFPRIILSEFNTHRVFSRNSASSRAIPIELEIKRVLDNPFTPLVWGINKSGMQAKEELSPEQQEIALRDVLVMRDVAVLGTVALYGGLKAFKDEELAERIEELDKCYKLPLVPLKDSLHKQNTNRYIEPYMWHTVIVTATEWDNFFGLRDNEMAQPEIDHTAKLMLDAHNASRPSEVGYGEWHLPLIQADERDLGMDALKKISAARCARVSYLTHDGVRDTEKDLFLYKCLLEDGHMSPFEHPATPLNSASERSGNLMGWKSHRQELPHEDNYLKIMLERGDDLDERLLAFVKANM